MATTAPAIPKPRAERFSSKRAAPEDIFTPERFHGEHHAIRKTTDEFFRRK